VRRIQKVGTSSLVVTLPKHWLKRMGLDQGSQVMLVDEGDGIKILPVERRSHSRVGLDLSREPYITAVSIPVCMYLSGVEKAGIKIPSKDLMTIIRQRALNFMGLHVMETGENEFEVEVLLDMDRVDINLLIKSLGSILNNLISSIEKALRGEGSQGEVGLLRQDFMRTLYVILRYLVTRKSRSGNVTQVQMALSASYVSLAVEVLYSIMDKISKHDVPGGDVALITLLLDRLQKEANTLLYILASPSIKRLEPLVGSLKALLGNIEEAVDKVEDPSSAFILGKIHDAVSILLLAAYVIICIIINEKIKMENSKLKG